MSKNKPYAIMLLSTASAALGLWATVAMIRYTFFHESIQFAGSLTFHPPLATALSMPLVLAICLLTLSNARLCLGLLGSPSCSRACCRR
ncbi:hypothetical protein LF1_14570 [Rubripirellula obstinata]|uniref:Uncharacterized protein n=1 Tax=Rubripirellula obstinata TaxID=406547 RepID=A0A5B1CHD6_9BACT|nr:hypothetical protein [Rubripirellula obstinata]KAA1258933.1 hypothetical protein LF1_14570 [Rubripirellula obstinata]